jgi:hypothetical protein
MFITKRLSSCTNFNSTEENKSWEMTLKIGKICAQISTEGSVVVQACN